MRQLIDFFCAPYAHATAFQITLEIVAVFFGIVSVLYAKKENIRVFPTGIVSTVLYVYICYEFTLYGDMVINLYYTLMSFYGWYVWNHKPLSQSIEITTSNSLDMLKAFGIFISTAAFVVGVYLYYDRFDRVTDYFDTFTSGIFFAGMWLMAHKKIEHWMFWILGNLISIPLYFVKGLGFSGLQFTIFLILAVQGYIEWKKHLNK
jgi:nicotinamide mononucleotide transporter